MKSLAIDTSGKTASIALFNDNKLLSEIFLDIGFTHSQTLSPAIDFCLKITKNEISSIDQFIVTTGPGSFTGLRIGIATIKGLAASKQALCKGVSTIETLAYNLIDFDGVICPTMDAKCNQVYTGIFECKSRNIIRLEKDCALSLDELKLKLQSLNNKKIFLLGDGANLCYNYFKNQFENNLYLTSENLKYQKASSLFFASKNKDYISHFDLCPTYLRLSQAQRQLLKKGDV